MDVESRHRMARLVNNRCCIALIIIAILIFSEDHFCRAIVIGLSRGRPSYSVTLRRGPHKRDGVNIQVKEVDYGKRTPPQSRGHRAFKVIVYEDLAAVGDEFSNDNIILSYSRGAETHRTYPDAAVASERSESYESELSATGSKPIRFPTERLPTSTASFWNEKDAEMREVTTTEASKHHSNVSSTTATATKAAPRSNPTMNRDIGTATSTTSSSSTTTTITTTTTTSSSSSTTTITTSSTTTISKST